MKIRTRTPWQVLAAGALVLAPVAGLALPVHPAGADVVRLDPGAPQAVDCQGTAGYNGTTDANNNPIWQFDNQTVLNTGLSRSTSCNYSAPGEAGVFTGNTPPILNGDTDPIDNAVWVAFIPLSDVNFPVSPTFNTVLSLQAVGTLSCGNGTLSGSGYVDSWPTLFAFGAREEWKLNWSTTIVNGQGTVTGTASSTGNGLDAGDPDRTVSGTIQILNNLPGGTCNDGPGGENVLLHLQLS